MEQETSFVVYEGVVVPELHVLPVARLNAAADDVVQGELTRTADLSC